MPRPHRRNALALVAAATACIAAWLATAPHSCLATNSIGGGLEAAAGAFQWDRATYWTLDPPPKADFLPEDEELIRVPRPAAKPAAHQPPPTRRILWMTPEDGPNRAETNAPGGRLPTRRRRRAVERTVVSGRGLQDWLGIPGPPPGNRETTGQVSEGVVGETASSTLRGSKYVPRGHQSDELSADKRNERNLHDIVQGSQKWSPTGKGVNSPSQFAVPKSPATQIDTSATSKIGSEDEQKAVHKEVQSQEIRLMRRIRSQPYNHLGYPVRDGSETAENRHMKLKTLSNSRRTMRVGSSNAFSRNYKDEDEQLRKKISGRRRLLWFQEAQDENRRSSFEYGEPSSSTASGPSSSSQTNSVLNQYGNTVSPDTPYRETEPSDRTYVKVLRRPISPGILSSLDGDPLIVHSGEQNRKVITPLLTEVFDEPRGVTENTERKYRVDDSSTLDNTVSSRAARHSSETVNSSDESESRRKIGDSTVLKQEDFAEMRDTVGVPVENSTTKEGIVSRNEPGDERSVEGTSVGVQVKNDGLATPNDVDLGTGEQRRIGRRLLGISPDEAAPGPAEDMGADREMTKEEEDALREQVVRDVVGDLLGVDGSGDGSGWGEIDS